MCIYKVHICISSFFKKRTCVNLGGYVMGGVDLGHVNQLPVSLKSYIKTHTIITFTWVIRDNNKIETLKDGTGHILRCP